MLVDKILYESVLKEEKIVNFPHQRYGNFVVIIGSPGAGKTFATQHFLNLDNFKAVNSDQWLEIIAKKEKIDLTDPLSVADIHHKIESPFKKFREQFIKQFIDNKTPPNLVVDITGKTLESLLKIVKSVDGSHYVTTLVYVMTSKDEALRRNASRSRRVPEEIIMSAYEAIQENYTKAMQIFDHVWIKIGDDFWAPFEGEVEYDEDGKVTKRTGSFKRKSDQILKVK